MLAVKFWNCKIFQLKFVYVFIMGVGSFQENDLGIYYILLWYEAREREREREREALTNKLKRHMYERMHMHTTQLDLKEKAFQLQAPALHMFVNKIC